MPERLADLKRFHELLHRLEDRIGGRRRLADCDGRMDWPDRGVYFFWNNNHVNERHAPAFLDVLERLIGDTCRTGNRSRGS